MAQEKKKNPMLKCQHFYILFSDYVFKSTILSCPKIVVTPCISNIYLNVTLYF